MFPTNMGFAPGRLELIFDKTAGDCDYCEKQLAWSNYGRVGYRGAWQVDHSIPASRGGTDHLNNLVPACVDCNQAKGDMTAQEFRRTMVTNSPRDGTDWGKVVLAGVGLWALSVWLKNQQPPPPSIDPFHPRWP